MARDPFRVGSPAGTELFKGPHLTIRCDHAQRMLLLQRTALPFQRVEEIEAMTQALARVFPTERRKGFVILSDFRDAPVRVHPALEPAFLRYREESERGFVRSAVIVATPVGQVRGNRLRDAAGQGAAIVTTVEDALAFLKGTPPTTK